MTSCADNVVLSIVCNNLDALAAMRHAFCGIVMRGWTAVTVTTKRCEEGCMFSGIQVTGRTDVDTNPQSRA